MKLDNLLGTIKNKTKIKSAILNFAVSDNITYLIGDHDKQQRTQDKDKPNRFVDAYKKNNIAIGMLSLAPHGSSGYPWKEICAHADICKTYCVGNSGSTQMLGRIKRTIAFKERPEEFKKQLCIEIISHVKKYLFLNEENNERVFPVIRLNGYSDILWEDEKIILDTTTIAIIQKQYEKIKKELKLPNKVIAKDLYEDKFFSKKISNKEIINTTRLIKNEEITIFDLFEGIIFYDYTRYGPSERKTTTIRNYHLSYSDSNNIRRIGIKKILNENNNVTFICTSKLYNKLKNNNGDGQLIRDTVPYKIILGDEYDCRFLDDEFNTLGNIILLSAQEGTKKATEQLQKTKKFVLSTPSDFKKLFCE